MVQQQPWRRGRDRHRGNGDPTIAFDRDTARSTITEAARDDEALRVVEAVLAGDRDAFRILVDREAVATVRACHRVLADLHDAEDAAQEAFVIAYRSLGSWRATGSFGAWLRRIAIRVAIRRASARRPTLRLDPITPDGDDPTAAPLGTLAAADADPAAVSLSAERAAGLRRAVQGLAEPYREVVALRFFGELSLAEIATSTDRPIATIKTHLRRGLLQLRADASSLGLDR
ncbi:MAG TPA: sigma-70 family RNA polymerase sigma factor [Candidatus Limnocylindrales bacterium]|nr:sigma-70 family RNA polymerase sigma factor [Candidatus Limnocylindrales bacterium]